MVRFILTDVKCLSAAGKENVSLTVPPEVTTASLKPWTLMSASPELGGVVPQGLPTQTAPRVVPPPVPTHR